MAGWKQEIERACGNAARKLERSLELEGKKLPLADDTLRNLLAENVCAEARTLDKRVLLALAEEVERRQAKRRGYTVTDRDMLDMRVRTTPAVDGYMVPMPIPENIFGGRTKSTLKLNISKDGGGVYLHIEF